MADILYLTNVRLSFPKLVEAVKSVENGAAKFAADLIMPPNHDAFPKFMGEIGKMATEKWKDHAQDVLKVAQSDRKLRCYGAGNEKVDKKTYKPYVGYADNYYISANSNEDRAPLIIRADGTPVDPANTMERQQLARKLYGGCFVNVAIRPWPQDNQFGRAIRCELIAVQFAKDGEPFGEVEPDMTGKFGAVAAPAAPTEAALFPNFM